MIAFAAEFAVALACFLPLCGALVKACETFQLCQEVKGEARGTTFLRLREIGTDVMPIGTVNAGPVEEFLYFLERVRDDEMARQPQRKLS
jgi:hypothetical protein